MVEKGSHTLKLFFDEVLVRVYRVGLGKEGSETPEGTFVVIDRLHEPVWFDRSSGKVFPYGHPDNPLGDHYIKLKHLDTGRTDYAIHGTRREDRGTIGTDASRGCIRMCR